MLGIQSSKEGGNPFSKHTPSNYSKLSPRGQSHERELSKDNSKQSFEGAGAGIPSAADSYNVATDIMQIVVENSE
jgi:hypothetical protein